MYLNAIIHWGGGKQDKPRALERMMKVIIWVFLLAMVPVFELRGAIPVGCAHGLPPLEVYVAAVIGNMVPVPFIILFIRKIFALIRKWWPKLDKKVARLESRALKKAGTIHKYELLGLALFVAVPLPGTGAWTGALIAALLDLRLKRAVPAIFIGVLLAGAALTVLSYGVRLGVAAMG